MQCLIEEYPQPFALLADTSVMKISSSLVRWTLAAAAGLLGGCLYEEVRKRPPDRPAKETNTRSSTDTYEQPVPLFSIWNPTQQIGLKPVSI